MQIFEFPANELMRISLKFEHLFNKAKYFSEQGHVQCSQQAVHTLGELLTLIDRVDLRTMFTRELSRHLANLKRLEATPQVDHLKLQGIMSQLEKSIEYFNHSKGTFAKELFDNTFIQTIRKTEGPPGSGSPYHIPEMQSWLHQNASYRQQQCQLWLSYFFDLSQTITFMLNLARDSIAQRTVVSNHGLYQENVQNPGHCQLIRIWLPKQFSIFPKFSLSQKKLNIRFLSLNMHDKSEQTIKPFEFQIGTFSF